MFTLEAKFYSMDGKPIVWDEDKEWLVGRQGKVLSPIQEKPWDWTAGTVELTWDEFVDCVEADLNE
jgi:hypothetical protein